ncbi:MAG: hypothetical protein A2176_02420 [Spirochaetes bacterium RBG_13_51_14]|nr:MAG: hypothetical protein A2176_02420 [Spirochaetes bacterium RBG_13_51_14]
MIRVTTIFLFILISSVLIAYPAKPADDDNPRVTILVLSKQIRLLREGLLKQISIIPGRDSIITDESNNQSWTAGAVTVLTERGRLRVFVDSREVSYPIHYRISGITGDDMCAVKLGNEERRYPLPFLITGDEENIRCYTEERLRRFAVESAMAEYSQANWKETEAIMALAHAIMARYYYAKKEARHQDADFCDLTHCQVYRGRIDAVTQLDDNWMIEHDKLKHNLFFHSRCGGSTVDISAFGDAGRPSASPGLGVRDWLFREGVQLCTNEDSRWERSISRDELMGILFPDYKLVEKDRFTLELDRDRMRVRVCHGAGTVSYPVETFRLMINRVKGWSFIRSNSFRVAEKTVDAKKLYIFQGEGLGHCVGLCQHGAVGLARRGYSRYEILEHYYPDLELRSTSGKCAPSPYLSYVIFDISSGRRLDLSHGPNFLSRTVPPGSVFKLIVSLYCASERSDIFNDYDFTCPGVNTRDPNMPDRCWNAGGHGRVRMLDAIPNSCNLYFASLYNRISKKRFMDFFQRFCRSLGIDASLPEISSDRQWSELLAGLDFRLSFTVSDYVRIVRFLHGGADRQEGQDGGPAGVPLQNRLRIFQSLKETFIRGTASGRPRPYGASCNYRELDGLLQRNSVDQREMWGKTATVIDGTNRAMSYGLFIGGSGNTGIVAVLRKGNGHIAAKWAQVMLSRFAGDSAD